MKNTNYTELARKLLAELAAHNPPDDLTGKIARVRRYFVKVRLEVEEERSKVRTIASPLLPKALERLAKSFPGLKVEKVNRRDCMTYAVSPQPGWRWAKLAPEGNRAGKVRKLSHPQEVFYSSDSVMLNYSARTYGVERIPESAQDGAAS